MIFWETGKITGRLFKFFERTFSVYGYIGRYLFFVLQIIGWVLVLFFVLPILSTSFVSIFGVKFQVSNSDFILLITAAFILAYTYETRKLKEETIFQRKMASASDISFRMTGYYRENHPDKTMFGTLMTAEVLNNVSKFTFLSSFLRDPIGRCGQFQKNVHSDNFLHANYFIETQDGREAFLKAIQFQNGEIKARVLITNGTEFIYTFQAVQGNWKRTLEGAQNLEDQFILVRKELYEMTQ